DGQPLFRVPLPRVDGLIAQLEEASGSSPDARPISLVRQSYGGDRTIGAAFVQFLADLLGPLGITVLDAGHDAVRVAGFETLRHALTNAAKVEGALVTREAAIRRAGLSPQVEAVPGRSLVFDMRDEKARIPIDRAGAAARTVKPGELAPNVLLRPIVERTILPTVAYVAGPGEIAYFAQSSAVAQALQLLEPLAVPRWSVTIVEPHVEQTLAEFNLGLSDLATVHAVEARLARAIVPESLLTELTALRSSIDQRLDELRGEVITNSHVPISAQAIEGARRALQFRVDRLERRVLAAAKHVDRARLRRVNAAVASVYPLGKRQERAANVIPFLARYGMGLVDNMRSEADAHARRLVSGQPIS
ncbi:MAG TPA: bacillithiol biosynthesis BshC, partial [Gemmatimonadaceae bacterium]|nr:bacillithiol biosynthesis BshC [Gemmatimonadaceae bacterium]